jgi:hypothetical protein
VSNDRALAVGELADVVRQLGHDELRSLVFLARRLHAGQRQYGEVDLAHDKRDFDRERSEEIADLLVYSAFGKLARVLREGGHGEASQVAAGLAGEGER